MALADKLYREVLVPPFLNSVSIGNLLKQLDLAEEENINFIVFRGSDSVFCDGLDLKWVVSKERGNYTKEMKEYGKFLKKIQTSSFISIAIVDGSASGGGMGIVCACDYVIAGEKSTFCLPEGLLGLIPGMIMPALLNRLTPQQIKKMVFTGQRYESQIACDFGIVDEVAAVTNLQSSLDKALNKMGACKKGSVRDLKQLLYTSHLNKDRLAQLGMNILSGRLSEEEINNRLKAIADFMDEPS